MIVFIFPLALDCVCVWVCALSAVWQVDLT